MVRIRLGPFPYLLNSPDTVRQALVSQGQNLEKGFNSRRTKRLTANGLVRLASIMAT